jgi:hypothetical protein
LPHSLPIVPGCSCDYPRDNVWSIYCHVVANHKELLFW